MKKVFKTKTFRRIMYAIGAGILLLVFLILSVVFGVFGDIPNKKDLLAFEQFKATEVLAQNGELIGKIYLEDRSDLKFEDLPKYVIEALIATEDARYYKHEGLDTRSLLRVIFKTILLNQNTGGGSTITQQLAKNMYGRSDAGFLSVPVAKVKEIIIAYRLEKVFTKDQILSLYLNQVPFGENVFGIESASQRFFNKSASELNVEEGAVLIGMLKGNTLYNPRLYPERSLDRRNTVLYQMVKYDYLEQSSYDSLSNVPLALDYANMNTKGPANYFMVQVKQEAQRIIDQINETSAEKVDLKTDGLIIETTLNIDAQEATLESFKSHLGRMQKVLRDQYFKYSKNRLTQLVLEKLKQSKLTARADEKHIQNLFDWEGFYTDTLSVRDSLAYDITLLHAGMLALDPNSGAIRVWVGGIDQHTQPYDQIFAQRQLASTFKPVLYAAALEKGIDPCVRLENDTIVFKDFENWSPSNYDHSYGGTYSMAGALTKSMNIPSVNLYIETGYDQVLATWRKMGFSSNLKNKPSSALGSANASIYESAIAYACFANGGFKVKPFSIRSIRNQDGQILYEYKSEKPSRVLSEKSCSAMNQMLSKVINEGTGQRIKSYGVNLPLAGKTGTSQDYADAWFIAYNPEIVWVTRVGASSPKIHFNSGNGSGSSLALPLVGLSLQKLQYSNTGKAWRKQFSIAESDSLSKEDCPDYLDDFSLKAWLDELFDKRENESEEQDAKRDQRKTRVKSFLRKVFGQDD